MEKHLIENLRGVGRVLKDHALVGEAPYKIAVFQEYSHGVPTLKDIEGNVSLELPTILDAVTSRAKLTLEMEDGRRLAFFFRNTDGQIANMTGIYDPKATE